MLFWLAAVHSSKKLLPFLGASSFLISTCVILQANRIDPLALPILKSLLYPYDFLELKPQSETFLSASGTLGNRNLVGLYMGMVLPIFVVLAIGRSALSAKIFYGLCATGALLALLSAQSKLRLAAAGLALLPFFLLQKSSKRTQQVKLAIIAILAAAVSAAWFINVQVISDLRNSVRVEGHRFTTGNIFQELSAVENGLTLKVNDAVLTLRPSTSGIDFLDRDGQALPVKLVQSRIEVADHRYRALRLEMTYLRDLPALRLSTGGRELILPLSDGKLYVDVDGKLRLPQSARTFPDVLPDAALGGRGFIWARTLPLIADKPFLGHGPGQFAADFPQNDLGGQLNVSSAMSTIVDKPHNYFLWILHRYGIVGITCFAVLCFSALRRREKMSPESFAIQCGLYGFLVSAGFTDAAVSVAPVFWVLLGLSIDKYKDV